MIRPLLGPGIALATAGAVTLGPALVAPPAPAAPVIPTVHVADLQLAGIGQDIYNAITPYVQYAVGGVSYLINFTPIIGGLIAAQININYFQGVQPVVESTVNYLASVVQDPLNFFPETGAYANELYGIGYNWVSAELRFLGFGELPPLAPSASVTPVATPRSAASRAVPTADSRPAPRPVTPPAPSPRSRIALPAAAASDMAPSRTAGKVRTPGRAARTADGPAAAKPARSQVRAAP